MGKPHVLQKGNKVTLVEGKLSKKKVLTRMPFDKSTLSSAAKKDDGRQGRRPTDLSHDHPTLGEEDRKQLHNKYQKQLAKACAYVRYAISRLEEF